jgi:hypothetical protein
MMEEDMEIVRHWVREENQKLLVTVETLAKHLRSVMDSRNAYMCNSGKAELRAVTAEKALAAAHTKALAQEGLIAGLNVALESEKQAKFRVELAHETDTGLLTAERDAALAQVAQLQTELTTLQAEFDNDRLATPSPAPVAVGQDSAGPTPRTDAAEQAISEHQTYWDSKYVHLLRFARGLERELTTSESLRREADRQAKFANRRYGNIQTKSADLVAGIRSAPHGSGCAIGMGSPCNCWKAPLLTPPVAGEGGEG